MITIDFEVTQGDGSGGSNHNARNTYIVQVKERDKVEILAENIFSYDVSALTQFEVSRLDSGNEKPEARFGKLKEFGSRLYRTLFNESIESVWKVYKEQNDFVVMCLRIHPKAKQLEILPWETMYDGKEFIAAGSCIGFNRLPLDIAPINDLAPLPKPLKMLALLSSPLDLVGNERLLIENEHDIILRAMNDPAGQGMLQVDFEDEAQLPIIENSLETPYSIFHYSGHGGIDSDKQGGLLLEDNDGNKRFTPVDEVIQTLHKGLRHFRLAVIAGCQTAKTLYASQFSDFGRALVRKGVPAVIAMQFSITDEGGLMLAETLYPKLAEGQSLEKALHTTRRKMLQSEHPHIQADALAAVSFIAGQDVLKTIDTPKESSYEDIHIDLGSTLTIPRLSFLFYGRRKEYRIIRDGILKNNERVIIVHGIGGIGKTSLVGHVIEQLGKNYKGLCFFDCRMGVLSPDMVLLQVHRELESKGIDVLKQVMNRCLSPEQLGGVMGQVLSQVPVLVVFDNFETQLKSLEEDNEAPITKVLPGSRGGFFKKSPWEIRDENLKTFLEALVKTTAKSSCYLFTTRYVFEIDERRVGMVRLLPLHDLIQTEALGLMQHLPNLSHSSFRDKKEAYRVFGGHPYGIVTLDKYCSYKSLGEVLKDTGSIQKELREFMAIEMSYGKLTPEAKELLNRFAAFREPMAWDAAHWVIGEKKTPEIPMEIINNFDRNQLPDELKQISDEELLKLVQGMMEEQRYAEGLDGLVKELIGWGLMMPMRVGETVYLTVHSLVREFCKEQCGEEWKAYLKEAADFYSNRFEHINEYEKTLTTVLSEVEGAELLMEAGECEDATVIIAKVNPLLDRWGWGRLVQSLYLRLVDKVEKKERAAILQNLGILMQGWGDVDGAQKKFEQSLNIIKEIEDQIGLAYLLHHMGRNFQFIGDSDQALSHFNKSLKIKKKNGDKWGEATSLHHIGIIYQERGNYKYALVKYRKSKAIFEKLGDLAGVSNSLYQKGMIFHRQNKYKKALLYYKQSIDIKFKLNEHAGLAKCLHQKGMVLLEMGETDLALDHFEKSLQINEDIGDPLGIAMSLGQISSIYINNEEYDTALSICEQVLERMKKLFSGGGQSLIFHQIGVIYQLKGDNYEALEYYKKSLDIKEKIGDRAGVAQTLHNIGAIYQDKGKYHRALAFYEQSFKIAEELGNRAGIASSLSNIGQIHIINKKYIEAFEKLLIAFYTYIELRSPDAKITLTNLIELRDAWGAEAFDKAWLEKTGEPVPEFFNH